MYSLESKVDKLNIDKLKNTSSGLSSLKSKVDKLDIDKLKNVPKGLSSLKSKIDKLDTDKLETKLDNLGKKVKVISTKGLTQRLIN